MAERSERERFSSALNRFMQPKKNNVTNRSPYWTKHDYLGEWDEEAGWSDEALAKVQKRSNTLNRTVHETGPGIYGSGMDGNLPPTPPKLPPWIEEAMNDPEGWECFHCKGNVTYGPPQQVMNVCYNEKKELLMIQFRKSRTGTRGGVPPGNRTVYDHVPKQVFLRLKATNEAEGHVGVELWNIVRTRGNVYGSRYPYTNS